MVATILGLLAAWNVYRGHMVVVWLLAVPSGLLTLAALFAPSVAKVFDEQWMKFAAVLGYINARIFPK